MVMPDAHRLKGAASPLLRGMACICASSVICGLFAQAPTAPPDDQIIAIFDEQPVEFDKALADGTQRDDRVRLYRNGQEIERTISLPPLPANMRDARRIVATLIVAPELVQQDDKVRPVDAWTRLGSVTIAATGDMLPLSAPTTRPAATTQPSTSQPSDTQPDYPATTVAPGAREIELMRFVTPFGGPATYTADLTALAPLLAGEHSIRVWISTWKQPAWKVTLTLSYTSEGVGYRRPLWAAPIFNSEVTAEKRTIKASVDVPRGVARPRLHLLTTGHATDGAGGDEFISRSHVLRIDGVEVARWRPWSERGGTLRETNPTSGRMDIDGRPLWASDLDRSGWNPGLLVEPMQVPLPELTAGKHAIELEILNIRQKDQSGYGYWRVSGIVVADEPWPPGDETSGPP